MDKNHFEKNTTSKLGMFATLIGLPLLAIAAMNLEEISGGEVDDREFAGKEKVLSPEEVLAQKEAELEEAKSKIFSTDQDMKKLKKELDDLKAAAEKAPAGSKKEKEVEEAANEWKEKYDKLLDERQNEKKQSLFNKVAEENKVVDAEVVAKLVDLSNLDTEEEMDQAIKEQLKTREWLVKKEEDPNKVLKGSGFGRQIEHQKILSEKEVEQEVLAAMDEAFRNKF